jgi:hypothetical protein
MNWLNGTQGKMIAMLIGGLVYLGLRERMDIPNFKPPLHLRESAPDWTTALTWGMAAAIFAAIIAYFRFGPKIAGPIAAVLICAAIFVRISYYG